MERRTKIVFEIRLLWIVFPSNFRQENPESVQIIGNKPVFQFTGG